VEDNPKNKGKDMLQQWSMAKKTLEGGLAELAQVIATKKMENKKVHKLKLPTKNTLSATGRDTEDAPKTRVSCHKLNIFFEGL
jgi:hypothetical protein